VTAAPALPVPADLPITGVRARRRAVLSASLAVVLAGAVAGVLAWQGNPLRSDPSDSPGPTATTAPAAAASGTPTAATAPLTGLDWPDVSVRLLAQDPDPCLSGTVEFESGRARRRTGEVLAQWQQVAAHRPQAAIADLDRDDDALVVACAIPPGS